MTGVQTCALPILNSNAVINIVDTEGKNTVQLVDGLTISSSTFASNAVSLSLSNGASITISGADKFSFDIGGNATTNIEVIEKNFFWRHQKVLFR